MTHTLHRQGDEQCLKKDFIVFSMAAQSVNAENSVPKLKKIFEIISKHNPVNLGDVKTGNIFVYDKDEIFENIKTNSYIHFVFDNINTVKNVLADLKNADVGLSVVVSGLFKEIDEACREVGLKPHTVEFSAGIIGKRELLPEEWVLEITTMCGHGLISSSLVRHIAKRIRLNKISLNEGAVELAKQCQCGVFNPVRAKEILKRVIDNQYPIKTDIGGE